MAGFDFKETVDLLQSGRSSLSDHVAMCNSVHWNLLGKRWTSPFALSLSKGCQA